MANAKIYIAEKQIERRLNKESGRHEKYIFNHTKLKDSKTGEPIKMVRVLLPSASHRELQFEHDSNGIDRNSRKAYIQVPLDAIKDTKIMRLKVLYLTCPKSTFTVYFEAEKNRDRSSEKFGSFDKPEKIVLNIKDVQKIWPTSLKSKVVEKIASKAKKQEKENNVKKETLQENLSGKEVSETSQNVVSEKNIAEKPLKEKKVDKSL